MAQYTNLSIFIYNSMLGYDESKHSISDWGYILVPITEIDNIECDVSIRYTNKHLKLSIVTDYLFCDDDGDSKEIELWSSDTIYKNSTIEFDTELIKVCLDKWFMDIEELKFCKLRSRFYKKYESNIFDFIKTMKNIKCGEDCAVCYEKTNHKTHCQHSICVPCLIKVKETKTEEDNEYQDMHKHCPICRESL